MPHGRVEVEREVSNNPLVMMQKALMRVTGLRVPLDVTGVIGGTTALGHSPIVIQAHRYRGRLLALNGLDKRIINLVTDSGVGSITLHDGDKL
jgi:hypothetical protein